jgi:ABC-type nitrate/sulfonate/bicarbonate transport system substrate-binding protein
MRRGKFPELCLALGILAGLLLAQARADDGTLINLSFQPGTYTALPFYLANQHGWWKAVGLQPTMLAFPSGPPQVAAAASNSWDVGEAGSPPAVLGAARYDLVTVGIADDGAATNQLLAHAGTSAAIKKNPAQLKGQQVLLTANSTGEYAVNACLHHLGLTENDVQVVSMGPAQIVSAFSSGTGTLAGTWTPYANTVRDKSGAELLCDGRDANVGIPTILFARGDYAKSHPDLVAKTLAVYLHGVRWIHAHPDLARQAYLDFNHEAGNTITMDDARTEIAIHPMFELKEQLKLMDRSRGSSTAANWFAGIIDFMKRKGSIDQSPDPKVFLTDDYLKLVGKDPKLRQFAETADLVNGR